MIFSFVDSFDEIANGSVFELVCGIITCFEVETDGEICWLAGVDLGA